MTLEMTDLEKMLPEWSKKYRLVIPLEEREICTFTDWLEEKQEDIEKRDKKKPKEPFHILRCIAFLAIIFIFCISDLALTKAREKLQEGN